MDPAPRPQDSTAIVTPADLAAIVCGFTDAPESALLTDLLRLGQALSNAQRASLADLLKQFAQAVTQQDSTDQRAHWERVLAHVPGLAPALEVLDAHAMGMTLGECPACHRAAPTS